MDELEVQNRYSIYSVKDGFENRARGISGLGSLVSTPWTHKSIIYNRGTIFQARRRGFEPRLPLQNTSNKLEDLSVLQLRAHKDVSAPVEPIVNGGHWIRRLPVFKAVEVGQTDDVFAGAVET